MSIHPKYRLLSKEELLSLEKEFIDFLIVNGVMADDWEDIKKDTPDKADDFIKLFSDVILEGILRKTIFLEYRDAVSIKAFQCLKDKIVLIGLDGNASLDLTNPSDLEKAIDNPPSGFKVFTTDKRYNKSREKEIFDMIQAGCQISDGKIFKTLSLALK